MNRQSAVAIPKPGLVFDLQQQWERTQNLTSTRNHESPTDGVGSSPIRSTSRLQFCGVSVATSRLQGNYPEGKGRSTPPVEHVDRRGGIKVVPVIDPKATNWHDYETDCALSFYSLTELDEAQGKTQQIINTLLALSRVGINPGSLHRGLSLNQQDGQAGLQVPLGCLSNLSLIQSNERDSLGETQTFDFSLWRSKGFPPMPAAKVPFSPRLVLLAVMIPPATLDRPKAPRSCDSCHLGFLARINDASGLCVELGRRLFVFLGCVHCRLFPSLDHFGVGHMELSVFADWHIHDSLMLRCLPL
ncbi:hypothetical protein R1flu_008152 [Riccia fluitans]|uniref:Uncharacterized protein n=1 Tax=Riccia fluitans TaxID=41844 RepID=A0ABD1YAY0_9MARC